MHAVKSRLFAVLASAFFVLGQLPSGALAQEAAAAGEPVVKTYTDGTHLIDASTLESLAGVVVTEGATALIDFGSLAALNFTGDFVNHGTVYFGSSNADVLTASLSAANIINQTGATLSSILPAGGVPGFSSAVSNLSINLTAVQQIINAGSVTSAGNLSMVAGGSITNSGTVTAAQNLNIASMIGSITNSGTMAALAGNLNIASVTAQNMAINNLNGVMQALNGSINVRDALFDSKHNLDIVGGDWLSKELNLYSGSGAINMDVEELTGQLNIDAGVAHTLASTGTLKLGNLNISGDPTFYNDAIAGDIEITGNITAGEALAIVASGNIFATANRTIAANDGSDGFDITLVAGANITSAAGGTSSAVSGSGTAGSWSGSGTPATASVTIDGPSSTGGNIDFTGLTVNIRPRSICGTDCDGGSARLIAFSGSGGGAITFGADSAIQTMGNGSGVNGNVTVIAPALIQLGSINTEGGSGGGGLVSINANQPAFAIGSSLTFDTDGTIAGGNDFTPGSIGSGAITLNGEVNAAGNVTISGGTNADITINANVTSPGSVSVTANGTGDILTPVSVLTTIGGINDPTGTAIARDGTFLYLASPAAQTIFKIDTDTNSVDDSLVIGGASLGEIALSPDGSTLYASNSSANTVIVVNTADMSLGPTISLSGVTPRGLAVTPDGTRLYVANTSSDNVSVVDTTLNTELTTLEAEDFPFQVAVHPTGSFVYVTNVLSDNVSVFNTSNNQLAATISVGTSPAGVAVNPNGLFAYVTNDNSDDVSVVDLASNTTVATISGIDFARNVDFNPQGTLAYVQSINADTVSIIDTGTNAIINTVAVGDNPQGGGTFVATVGQNVRAYVANRDGDSVSVLNMPTIIGDTIGLQTVSGSINVATDAGMASGGLTIPGGSTAVITEINDLGLDTVSLTDRLLVGNNGQVLRVEDSVSANNITLQNTSIDSTINVGALTSGSSSVTLTTVGALSAVRQTASLIEATAGSVTINSPQLGGSGDEVAVSSADSFVYAGTTLGNNIEIQTTNAGSHIVLFGDATATNSLSLETAGDGQILSAMSVSRTVGVGGDPTAAAVSPNGLFAYVVNTGDDTVSVISTSNNQVTDTITVGSAPTFVAFTPDSAFAYVLNNSDNTITVINTADNTTSLVTDPDSDLVSPAAMVITPDGQFGYVTNSDSNTVAVVNLTTNTVVDTVQVGNGPVGITITPTGRFVYVANSDDDTVSIIQTSTNTVIESISVGTAPGSIVANPNGLYVYALNVDDASVSILDTFTNSIVDTVNLDGPASGININPQGTLVYLNDSDDGELKIYETARFTQIDAVQMHTPSTLGNFVGIVNGRVVAYVPNTGSQTVSVTPMPLFTAPSIELISGGSGDINVSTNNLAGNVDAATGASVYITGFGNVRTGFNTVAETNFLVGTLNEIHQLGEFTPADPLARVIYQSTGLNGLVSIDNVIGTVDTVTATTVGPSSSITITEEAGIFTGGNQRYVTSNFELSSPAIETTAGNIFIGASNNSLNLSGEGSISAPNDFEIFAPVSVSLAQGIDWTVTDGALDLTTASLFGPDNDIARMTFLSANACVCFSEQNGESLFIGAQTDNAPTTISIDVPDFFAAVGGPNFEIQIDNNTILQTTGYIEFDLFGDSDFTNRGTVRTTATPGEPTIGIVTFLGALTMRGTGTLDPGAGNSVGIFTLDHLVLDDGLNQNIISGDLLIASSSIHGSDGGTATLAVTNGGGIFIGDDCGCLTHLHLRAQTPGQLTTMNFNAPTVTINAVNMEIENGTTASSNGAFNITLGDDSFLPFAQFTLDGILRQTGAGTLTVSSTPGEVLRLNGDGAIQQNNAVPAFTAFMSDTQITYEDGVNYLISSTSALTSSPVYIDSPVHSMAAEGTATITTDGGAISIAPLAGSADQIFGNTGTLNFNGGPVYVAANNITIDDDLTFATDNILGFVVGAGGSLTNNGDIVATGSCAGCNGINQFFIGAGDMTLAGASIGEFSPGTQGVAFVVNSGFALTLSAGIDMRLNSGGLAYFQGSTIEFESGSLFQALNNATISLSAPPGSDLTVVLPDNGTAELRSQGGVMGIVPQTNGTSIFFENSNNVSLNNATLLLNVTLPNVGIYIGTFPPGSTNLAPNVNIQSAGSPIIYFGTVNGLTQSILNTTGEPSLSPVLNMPESEDEAASGQGGTASDDKAESDLKPVAYMHGGTAPLDGMLSERQVAADALITGRVRLEGQALAALQQRGVSAWQEGDGTIRLDAGSLLIAPNHDIVVRTPEGDVHVEAGSAVYVLASGKSVAVYSLHDDHAGAVKFAIGSETLSIRAGRHVVLTRNHVDTFSAVNPLKKLGYRSPREHRLENGLRVFQGEFSLVSALGTIGGARELLASRQDGHRALCGRMLKTAAIQAYITARNGAFAAAAR